MAETAEGKGGFFQNRTVVTVLGIAGVIGLVQLLSKMFGKSETEEKADKARKKIYTQIKPSYTDNVYKDYADILARALALGMTEDEDAVYGVFEGCKNVSDVVKIIEFYDTHRIFAEIGGSSLPETIGTLFSAGEKKHLNGILHKKGIDYTFK